MNFEKLKNIIGEYIVNFGLSLIEKDNIYSFAECELKAIGLDEPDSDYNGELSKAVLNLVKLFSLQGHSGFSANRTISLFKNVSMFKPLSPLTGDDSEWTQISDNIYQNKRCSSVFKEKDVAYDINGKVFLEPNGVAYTNIKSHVNITFPYIPETEYVNVDYKGNVIA